MVNRVHGNQAVVGGAGCYSSPSTPRIQPSRIASGLARVPSQKHRQLAKDPIPLCESLWTVCSLEDLLQYRRRQPYRVATLQCLYQKSHLDCFTTSQKCDPNGGIHQHRRLPLRTHRLRVVAFGDATGPAKLQDRRIVTAAHVVIECDVDSLTGCFDAGQPLDVADQLRVKNNVGTLGSISARFHRRRSYTFNVYRVA
jgi:hypothetical protein